MHCQHHHLVTLPMRDPCPFKLQIQFQTMPYLYRHILYTAQQLILCFGLIIHVLISAHDCYQLNEAPNEK